MSFRLLCFMISHALCYHSIAQGNPLAVNTDTIPIFKPLGQQPIRPLLLSVPSTLFQPAYCDTPLQGRYIDDLEQLQRIQQTWYGVGQPTIYPFYCHTNHEYLWYQADTLRTTLARQNRCQSYSVDNQIGFMHLNQGADSLIWKPLLVYLHRPVSYQAARTLLHQLQKNPAVLVIQDEKWMHYNGFLSISYKAEAPPTQQVPQTLLNWLYKRQSQKWLLSQPSYSQFGQNRSETQATVYLYCSTKMAKKIKTTPPWTIGPWNDYNFSKYPSTAFSFHSYWKKQ